MNRLLLSSLLILAVVGLALIPSVNALPVQYNQTALNFGFTSVPRNSSSYDVFPLIPDNWLWYKFDNNTADSSTLGNSAGTITYNSNAKAVYHFENVLTDATTNGFTLTKAAGTNNFVSGAEGLGIQFDGSTYYTANSAVIVSGTADRTISFWIYTPSTFIQTKYVYSYGVNTNNNLWLFEWTSTGQSSGFTLFTGGVGGQNISSNTILQPNTWYHISVTLQTSGTVLKFYVNGILDKSSTITALNTSSSSLFLGAFIDGSSTVQSGVLIDEFRVYNIAISISQDKALYMQGHFSQSHTFDGGESVASNVDFYNQPFTFSFWFNFPDNTAGTFNDNKGVLGNDIYGIRTAPVSEAHNRIEMFLKENDASVEPRVRADFTPNQYNYATFTWDKTTLKAYINGVLVDSQTRNLPTATSSTNINIGGNNVAGACCVVGQIDNVKIYPYALSQSQITTDQSLGLISSGKQFMSWYNGKQGSATLTEKLGSTKSTMTLSCTPDSTLKNMGANNMKIYYTCPPSGANAQVAHIDIISGSTTNDFLANNSPGSVNNMYVFPTITQMFFVVNNGVGTGHIVSKANGNVSANSMGTSVSISNQKVFQSTKGFKYNYNGSSTQTVTAVGCELYYSPTAKNQTIDNINCDISMPASMIRYWNGMLIQNIGSFSTNSTQQFLNSIDASSYKKLLSLPCLILVNETPCVTFIATDQTQTDWLVVLTSTHVYYGNAQTALALLQNSNYALQSYDVITQLTTGVYEIQNPILQSMSLYGFNVNTTVNKAGLFTLPSGYYVKTTSITPSIRNIDPRWTNDNTDIPIITSTGSLFPIFLTVSNAPSFAAAKITNPLQATINNQEAVWAVTQLDSTRSAEIDLPSNACVNLYVADISTSPSIWNFEGIICANGVNQKTVSYTNTLPLNFWTLKYGVAQDWVPNTNGLSLTFHNNIDLDPSYNVIIKHANGTTAQNFTVTIPANTTINTTTYNLTNVVKPAAVYVYVTNPSPTELVYSSYVGSALTLSSVSAFFLQNFTYQGFSLLSLIPIVFASMFTRNTVGIGVVLVVVTIATLSWLSIIVVPDALIWIMVVISVISLIAYRIYYG